MKLRPLIGVLAFASAAAVIPAAAAPFVPTSDSQIVERLPFTASDPAIRQLRLLHDALSKEPDNLPLALRLARGYLELGRATSDPRYGGYAQAALAPWWELASPPREVLVLRAALRQRVHLFDAALADLAIVVEADPRDAQAHLMRATVLQVVGQFDAARAECLALQGLTKEIVWTVCLAGVNAMTGRLHESYEQLRTALDRFPTAQPQIKSWALTSLGEMAARAQQPREAERHFRDALAIDPTDNYLLGAFADFLLDQDRPGEVENLLRGYTRADPLLLRFALALQAQRSPDLPTWIAQLRDRFEASHLRGDRVHLREEARFILQLLNDPGAALTLARQDWRVQKEPADVRILLEAAIAARSAADEATARDWLRLTRFEDASLPPAGNSNPSKN